MHAYIESVDQLEILRILAADPRKTWSADSLGREAQVSPQAQSRHLAELEVRGLLAVTRAPQPSYRHGPQTPELEAVLTRLLRLYHERPVSVIQAIYARTTNPLPYLADLFCLQKER